MSAEETTTWGKVCENVGLSDNLYRTCRQKVPGFMGLPNSALDDRGSEPMGVDDPGFSAALAKKALPIPAPPKLGDSAQAQEDSFFDKFPVNQLLLYSGVAALVWLLLKAKHPKVAAKDSASGAVTSPKAA